MRTAQFRRLARAARFILAVIFVGCLTPRTAQAYIDPSAGSILLQVLAASALAGLFFVKQSVARVLLAVRRAWTRLLGRP